MGFDQMLGDRQANAGSAACTLRTRLVHPVETLKQVGEVLMRNTNASVNQWYSTEISTNRNRNRSYQLQGMWELSTAIFEKGKILRDTFQ